MDNNQKKNKDKMTNYFQDFNLQQLLEGNQLELITIALLLTGKLKVDAVGMFRDNPVVTVTLLGKFHTSEKEDSNNLLDFLSLHEDEKINDILNTLNEHLQKGDDK